ncbi:MAG: AI-2E family transporter [Rhodothermales bacterium]|nr:AI-2E family transporter [Rhodothermales bacterium]
MLLELKTVLMPFAIAMLLSIIFKPVVIRLRANRVPLVLSLLGIIIIFALVLFLVGWLLFASVESMISELPKYEAKASILVEDLELAIISWGQRFNSQFAEFQWSDAVQWSSVTAALGSGVGSFISFVSTTFLVLLFMIFILAGSGQLAEKVRIAFPERYANQVSELISTIDSQVRQYLVTKTLISLATGFITWLVLYLLGVDFPLVWGFAAYLLNYIPNIGSTIAVIFPFLISLLEFDSFVIPLVVLLGLGSVQLTMGNVIEPRLMGFSLNLSPLLIIVSLIFWGWLWGIWGMILAVPLTATAKIMFENIQPLQPISVLMSGENGSQRPA